jgi:hypothetical protein
MYETTPPDVKAFGTYCRRRLRGIENEMIAAARKNET